jgi:hypothetical protein
MTIVEERRKLQYVFLNIDHPLCRSMFTLSRCVHSETYCDDFTGRKRLVNSVKDYIPLVSQLRIKISASRLLLPNGPGNARGTIGSMRSVIFRLLILS